MKWNHLAASNIFLSTSYLSVLEHSAPTNMTCRFIGLFSDDDLIGIAISQQLCLSDLESFGERDKRYKTKIRKWTFSKLSTNVLLLGNNMLTGQNAFFFDENLPMDVGANLLNRAISQIKTDCRRKKTKIHLTIYKDFSNRLLKEFFKTGFSNFTRFSTQPNMVFKIRDHWHSVDDYVLDLNKKYRDQYKRARKKGAGLEKRKLSIDEMISLQANIHQLYLIVAKQAPFNTFYLTDDHFIKMKRFLGSDFLFYGYFDADKLIGFSTLIKNGTDIDTYFLGYDDKCQRDKMLYLNMLYDMIAYGMKKGFKRVVLARTALEIKSSIGAEDVNVYGLIHHCNPIINKLMPLLFNYFEPKTIWQKRHPFKEQQS